MSLPSTIPFTAQTTASRAWSPSDRDQIIFRWVKFEGHKQAWVADKFGIDQSTVSRIVDRYQRWIARGGPAGQGSLSHEERIRAQCWLTYERNEWILAAALRIAGEVEHGTEGTRTVIARDMSNPSKETEMRSESHTIDRSAIPCRYLRLAHRINMDQQKLVEKEPLLALDPLTIEDSGDDSVSSPHAPREVPNAVCHDQPVHAVGCQENPARADRADDVSGTAELSNEPSDLAPPAECHGQPAPIESPEPAPTPQPAMHIVHNASPRKSSATRSRATSSIKKARAKKSSLHAYPVALSPPKPTESPRDAPSRSPPHANGRTKNPKSKILNPK